MTKVCQKNKPKVSVLVPIYNVESYIERCAISLFEQTYDNCEFIFVNDCTKDQSMEILNEVIHRYPKLSDRVKIVNHLVNQGLGAARLTGVKKSNGEYVTFVDSDDYVSSGYVEKLVSVMLKANSDVVLSSYNISDKLLNVSVDWYEKRVLGGRMSCRIWGSLLKRQIMDDYDIYPIVGIDYAEDFAFMTRYVSETRNIHIIPETIYYYTVDNANSYVHNVSDKAVNSLCRAISTISMYLIQKRGKRKYQKMINYAILEKSKGLKENCGGNVNFNKVLSLLEDEKLDLFEKKFKNMIEKGSPFWVKALSLICYSRL